MRKKVPFGTRVRTSGRILKEVMRFLSAERDLWVFPLLATLVLGVLAVPGVLVATATMEFSEPFSIVSTEYVMLVGIFAVVGLPFMVLMSLFNTAFAFAVWGRMEGHHTTKGEAWRRALGRTGTLFRFNIIAGIIGIVVGLLGMLLDRLRIIPGVGHVANLVGAYGWALASYFVIPVIAVERERSATGAIKRSVGIVREHLGTSVTGFVTVQLVLMLIFIPVLLASLFGTIFLMVAAAGAGEVPAAMPFYLVAAMFVPMLVMMVFSTALNTTYQTALYRFAMKGRIDPPFSVGSIVTAWDPYRK